MKISPEVFRLYAVSDRSWLKAGETLVGVTELLLQNGVTCLQLREKYLSDLSINKMIYACMMNMLTMDSAEQILIVPIFNV